MRIAIDVNGVLRDTIGKFTRVYESYLVNDLLETDDTNLNNENSELKFIYEFNGPVTSLTMTEFFKFKDHEEYLRFVHEEFPMQIFGHAPSTEMNTFNIFNEFYLNYRDNLDILLISEEIGKGKPATLFFLSKFGCMVEKIIFFSQSTKKTIWDEFDILLTADPSLLLNYPNGKTIIKFETEYNKNIDSTLTIKSLEELNDLIKKIL